LEINPLEVFGGLVLSALIVWVGYRRSSLSGSGAVGAWLVGTVVFGLGGWTWGVLLVGFFVTSSALSHYRDRDKASLAEKFAKGGRRDLGQVLANGGWGVVLALGRAFFPAWGAWLFVAYAGAMAAVNADTWATELGVLSRTAPRLITTGRRVPVGTSGAISRWGSGAALLGALVIAALAVLVRTIEGWGSRTGVELSLLGLVPVVTLGGLAGAFLDSFLGATGQGIYYCDQCQKETERRVHHCGQETRQVRGWRWLDNDGVNLLCSVAGSLVAVLLGNLLTFRG